MDAFARGLLAWYGQHGRHHLPWQQPRTAYRVWISEVMLQQTQVATVIAYFNRFVAAVPDVTALATAPEDRVMALWSGLGYYRRARYLQAAARLCVERHHGELPDIFAELAALPGIGRSTAGAILALARNQRHAILDGNVKRVLARFHGIPGWPGEPATGRALWERAEAHTPSVQVADYTQAIMDLGATVCTRAHPRCDECPQARDCAARRAGLVDVIPAPRPARALPERHCVFVVLRQRDGRVLLRQRPVQGVWPRLWSLPEAADIDAARALAARLARIDGHAAEWMPAITHRFTHFKLSATPMLWRGAQQLPRVADAADTRWYTAAEIESLGIPAPVRKWLHAQA
ncbi:MAG: A/G-specific adenine glycosylase [Rhodanobacteraceae bacterium]|nr:MAG: A/G-specific adenine glycosylase [Rhodanobacteraceae bacterium]